jgi:hypothetical protein
MCWFPANEELVAHPDEHIWAGGPVHLKLEGATPGNTGPMWVGP